ncbi:hypothetical protein DYB37_013459 [Aphanomyces astaci]|uniref:subtilisin n=1 Tax=Aphanomyces astaci TaxID=112090 RepID=A0A3R7C823_APHAT|nr:hypothetical protein DYB37_013459 [Aphanomyces astaci]
MLCPTDATGKNPKCELAPDVINNSWGNVGNSNNFQAVVDAWRAADIIPVFCNGNDGSKCSRTWTPADYKNVIAVGNVGTDDKLFTESSRGPTADGRIKPDVSAPGTRIRSAWNTGNSAYQTMTGTSMASPLVAGAIALYLNANKGAKYDQVYKAFTTTAETATLTPNNQNCGGVSDSKYPNNNYGSVDPRHQYPPSVPFFPYDVVAIAIDTQHVRSVDPRHQYPPSVPFFPDDVVPRYTPSIPYFASDALPAVHLQWLHWLLFFIDQLLFASRVESS